ncbi:MAG: N-formylglutamate amidohydrolase [Alphaproteobacteria bacterium RIFCSPHIGHO2_12_FULL_63_12]|nr:MAG: N-formylglutamate amidohydrolase [Alphaproteobacteria bacterium RIFCSPHIGHO2_12_FULL_63_12]
MVANEGGTPPAVEVSAPALLATPCIFASPHSGRRYPPELLRMSRLDRHALRQSEDSYVDLLFDAAPAHGAPLLRALFPRAWVDVNRSRDELDQRMFADPLPTSADTRSNRVRAGLGVIPRIVADGQDIYSRKLKFFEARRRLADCYDPYHLALARLIADARSRFGCAVVIDCHSMPSAGGAPFREGERAIDIVLGDRFGASCAPGVAAAVEQALAASGYLVSRNAPYAGGHVASAYGRPAEGVHVLQIEINRGLYLDEKRIARTDGFERLRRDLRKLVAELARLSPAALRPAQAAE